MDEFAYVLEESIKAPQKTLVAMPSMTSIPSLQVPQQVSPKKWTLVFLLE